MMSGVNHPEVWVPLKFMDILDVQGGTQPPKSQFVAEPQEGFIRLLQIRDFGSKPVPTYVPDTTKLKKCMEDDLLIGRYGASLGRICTGMQGAYNVALAKVQAPDCIHKKFLKGYLESELFQGKLRLLSRSAQNGFNKGDLESFDFFLPPLAEQKAIAEKLDTLLARVESTKARLERIPKILKRFRQSVLAAAVSGKLTEEWRIREKTFQAADGKARKIKVFRGIELAELPDGWLWLRFDQVARIASNLVDPKTQPDSIHIAPNHIESGSGLVSGFQTIKEDGVKSPKHKFYAGQILYSKIRPYLCKVAIAEFEGLCSADMYPIDALGSEKYLFRWMLTAQFTDWASNAESRSVLPKINQKDLSQIPVPTPSTEEQTEIVRRVDQLFAYADTIENQVNNALERVNNLTQSILAKAFRGELTEQWRKDNPDLISGENSASALLEKIKAERAAAKPVKQGRKKA